MEKVRRMIVTYKVPIDVVKGLVIDHIEKTDGVALENLEVDVMVLQNQVIVEATYPNEVLHPE